MHKKALCITFALAGISERHLQKWYLCVCVCRKAHVSAYMCIHLSVYLGDTGPGEGHDDSHYVDCELEL